MEFQCRNGIFALGHEIDRQKPEGEGQLGAGKDRSAGERGLMTAGIALITAVEKNAIPFSLAVGTTEALRPSPLEHGLPALIF